MKVNKNTILYEDWLKNQKEEDKLFVIDDRILVVFFERIFGIELEEKSTLSLFMFTAKYKNQTDLICNHLNYFVKYYDPQKRYVTALLKIKTLLDSSENHISEDSFIKSLYDHIITPEVLEQVCAMVELNNPGSIECEKKTKKYGKESSFTDQHNEILYRMAMCTNLLIPLILHYFSRFKPSGKMFIIDKYYDPLFEICGKGVNLKEKLFTFIMNEAENSQKRDSQIWQQHSLIGDFDPISYAEKILKNIISNIIPKLDYIEGSHNIALIRSTLSCNFINLTKEPYKLYPKEISNEKDNDDSLSQQDKIEMTISRTDLSNVIISSANRETVINKLQNKLKIEVGEQEMKFYKKYYRPTEFQMELTKLYFAKYFNGFSEMSSLSSDQYIKLAILLKYQMQAQGYKYLQHMIVGSMGDRTPTKSMRSAKFIDKIEQSSTYQRLIDKKFSKLLKLKGDRVILDKLSILLKTKFLFIDFNNQKLLNHDIKINEDIVCDEFLIFLSNI